MVGQGHVVLLSKKCVLRVIRMTQLQWSLWDRDNVYEVDMEVGTSEASGWARAAVPAVSLALRSLHSSAMPVRT